MGRNGDIVAHYEYSPFGSLTKVSGDYADSNPLRFSSEYFDEETGLIYYNYRYYNPELGRWISRDPIEEQGGYNLYGMIGNNPLYGWDMLGYELCSRCSNLTWSQKLALYLQTKVNNLADDLAGGNYYANVGIYWGAELANGALDNLNFGRDIADAIYNNNGDWLDKGAAMSPDLLRGANILMSAAGLSKATSPNVKTSGTPSSNLLPDEAWHKNAPIQVPPGTNEISHTKYNPHTGTLEKSNVKYDNYGRQIERVDYSDHGYPQNHTNPHTHKYEYNQTYPKGHEIK